MTIPGQTPLSEIDFFPKTFREQLEYLWIETEEEFFALEPVLSEVDPGFRKEWEDVEDTIIRHSTPKKIEYLRKFSHPLGEERPLGVAVYSSGEALRQASQIESLPLKEPLPSSYCLVEKFPQWFSPIFDQKESGECVACGVTSLVEFVKGRPEPLSYKFLHQVCKKSDGHRQSRGTDLGTATAIVSEIGICPESCYPNKDENFCEPDDEKCYAEAARYRVDGFRPVLLGDTRHFKAILSGGNGARPMPIAITLLVFDSWYRSLSSERTGKWTLPLPGERPRPCSHAVLIVGYEDASAPNGGYFIARNSWSESWGKEGYALIPYTYVQRYACDAFTGPKVLVDDFKQKYCRILEKNTRDCVSGRMITANKNKEVLFNPKYPEDVREYSSPNRKEFEEYNFVWREENRRELVKKAIEKMYNRGRGELGQESIRLKDIVKETGFTPKEVKDLFESLERRENYKLDNTVNGDLTIRRPEK